MKSKLLILTVAIATVAGIASAGTIGTPYITGDMLGPWDPAAALMTETALGSDIWTYTLTGNVANSYHEFKVTDGTWSSTVPGGNSWYYADGAGSDMVITYDGNTYADGWNPATDRIALGYNTVTTWEATGDFLTEIGGSGDWQNNSGLAPLTNIGGDIYSVTINDITAGDYFIKAVESGSWHAIGIDGRSVDAGNLAFTTVGDQNDVILTIDVVNNLAKVEVIPEPATIGLLGVAGVGMFLARRKLKI